MLRSEPELAPQQLVDDLRIGLAAGRFHDLAHEPADRRGLRLGLLDLVAVGGNHRIDGLLDGAGVGDLSQPPLLDDLGRVAPLAPDDLEHVLGDLARYRARGDEIENAPELLSRERACRYI